MPVEVIPVFFPALIILVLEVFLLVRAIWFTQGTFMASRITLALAGVLGMTAALFQVSQAFHLGWLTAEVRIVVLIALMAPCITSWLVAGSAQKRRDDAKP